MWRLADIKCPPYKYWFSDGESIHAVRSIVGEPYRLIVQDLGFLDLIEIPPESKQQRIIANDQLRTCDNLEPPSLMDLRLEIHETQYFDLYFNAVRTATEAGTANESYDASPIPPLSGKLKGVLRPNRADVALVDAMINNRHISYQKVPGSPRETKKVIEVLGRQFFPFTRYSFQLATCVFVWTPASFFGVVSLKVDDATSSNGGSSEMKTEHDEVSRPEWSKNESWLEKLMRSVAISDPIEIQEKVKDSDESYTTRVAKQPTLDGPVNRLMSLALGALPRTSFFQHPHLFSGVTGTDKPWLKFFWGESIDESLNSGHNREITTRTAWSFTDNIHDATKPWPETLLIANVSKCSSVWEHAAYVTPMSHNRTKAEYVFPPGSQFKFCDSGEAGSQDAQPKKMRVVVLEALPSIKGTGVASDLKQVLEKGPKPLEVKDIQKLVQDKP